MTAIEGAAQLVAKVIQLEKRAEAAEAALAQCQAWRQEDADNLGHCIRAKQKAEELVRDRTSEADACHEIMAECRKIAGDPHTGTIDAVRGLLARAEKAEAALAERDKPCVWRVEAPAHFVGHMDDKP